MELYLDLYTMYPLYIPIEKKDLLDLRIQKCIMAHIVSSMYYLTVLIQQATSLFDDENRVEVRSRTPC